MSWHANFRKRISQVGTFIPDLRVTLKDFMFMSYIFIQVFTWLHRVIYKVDHRSYDREKHICSDKKNFLDHLDRADFSIILLR